MTNPKRANFLPPPYFQGSPNRPHPSPHPLKLLRLRRAPCTSTRTVITPFTTIYTAWGLPSRCMVAKTSLIRKALKRRTLPPLGTRTSSHSLHPLPARTHSLLIPRNSERRSLTCFRWPKWQRRSPVQRSLVSQRTFHPRSLVRPSHPLPPLVRTWTAPPFSLPAQCSLHQDPNPPLNPRKTPSPARCRSRTPQRCFLRQPRTSISLCLNLAKCLSYRLKRTVLLPSLSIYGLLESLIPFSVNPRLQISL
ncbi:hypothetical protein BD311DRAFT_744971 [Dichomitus squalens]|uniref:Uncharacterized protein n=1 Tax=Dichomitus squalens TaxID=114155 RepID=A0A4Q9N5N8_9APHY|nr:hypothetical protein BD311DRAFT_744971 [Dichomitus squalens]